MLDEITDIDSLLDHDYDASRQETLDADVDLQEVRQRLKEDAEFFIEFFLGEELTSPVPGFHKEIWAKMIQMELQRILLAIPRDHAKTTLSKLAAVWYFLFSSHRFCVYLSNTNTIANNAAKDIINFMKTPNFEAVFGKIRILKETETNSLWIFEIISPSGRVKKCILRAVGAGQQMRGINIDNQRPDIAIVDDVEDNENTESELLQKKLDKWIFGPFIKALARQKKIIWLGNMLQKTSLLARLSRNPKWNPVVFGAIVKDAATGSLQPLWPERWPLAELKEDLEEYRGLGLVETWMCEMMNMPGHGENGFTQDQLNYLPVPGTDELVATCLVLDPAFGQHAHNDESSITVHGIPKEGPPMVLAQVTGRFSEHQLFREMIQQAYYWNAWVWGIEAIAAQRVLIPFFNLLLVGEHLNHSVEIIPLMAGKGDPKISRIRAWVALMAAGEYAIPEGDFEITQQLLSFDPMKKHQLDDLIDSCAYGPQMVNEYLHLLIHQYNVTSGIDDDFYAARYGMEISNV